jgi:hypothetical protein
MEVMHRIEADMIVLAGQEFYKIVLGELLSVLFEKVLYKTLFFRHLHDSPDPHERITGDHDRLLRLGFSEAGPGTLR